MLTMKRIAILKLRITRMENQIRKNSDTMRITS